MKKTLKQILILGILIVRFSIYGQEFKFDIHNTSLNEYIEMENNLGSEKIPNIRNHISLSDNAQPIKFRRKQKIISDLVAYYYFKKKDSTMSYILYEWDESLFTLKSKTNDKKSEKYQKALIRKYNNLEKTITSIYGKSESEGDLSNLKQANEKSGLNKKDKWFPNDSTEIEMYTSISNYYEKKRAMTISPTHRIRLYIRNTKKEKKIEPKLSEEKLDTLKLISKEFIKTLEDGNLVKSKIYLSEKILQSVTNKQLNILTNNLDFNRKTELIYSGIQVGLDGTIYTMLQFKYEDDISNPPNELIKIIFDNKNKIIGIQPIKLQRKE